MQSVRVKKAKSESYWYAQHIGKTFTVTGVEGNCYRVIWEKSPDNLVEAPILIEDCYQYTKKETGPEKILRNQRTRSEERSAFNAQREITKFEKLNAESEVKVYKIEDLT
ncbi:hypothetical protein ABGV42_01465 [Paenibacillus pabuli]|uniref:hypothetical protein n=1 Tax=Paenibacillus pabuli TaxID=1472 RepID=UPI003243005B